MEQEKKAEEKQNPAKQDAGKLNAEPSKAGKLNAEPSKAGKLNAAPGKAAKQTPDAQNPVKQTTGKVAVILIRGTIGLSKPMKDTLKMLNLKGKYNLVILENNKVNQGMIAKVKDYVTYGQIDSQTEKLLNEKRPAKSKSYRLHPPLGGFEKKGTKKTFAQGGALGPRKEKINELINKMI